MNAYCRTSAPRSDKVTGTRSTNASNRTTTTTTTTMMMNHKKDMTTTKTRIDMKPRSNHTGAKQQVVKKEQKRRHWVESEHMIFLAAYRHYGRGSWTKIAKHIPTR